MNTSFGMDALTAWRSLFGSNNVLGGIRVLESSHCQERVQFRFPRSKKKRIRNKWIKREENVRYEPRAYRFQGQVICHPSIAKRLREEFPPNVCMSHADKKTLNNREP